MWFVNFLLTSVLTATERVVFMDHLQICIHAGKYTELILQVVFFLIPFLVMTYCYIQIIRQVRLVKKALIGQSSSSQKTDIQLILMLGTTVIVFFMCWCPQSMGSIVYSLSGKRIPANYIDVTFTLTLCNSCLNIIVYGITNRHFRTAFKQVLCCTTRNVNAVDTG